MPTGNTIKTALFGQLANTIAVADLAGLFSRVVFVGSAVTGAADAVGYGCSPLSPFATLSYAVQSLTTLTGDTIVLMPGHAETVPNSAVAFTTAGIRIIGVGSGTAVPGLPWEAPRPS